MRISIPLSFFLTTMLPPPQSPSRSERLLRDTLLRDAASPKVPARHSRSPSPSSRSSTDSVKIERATGQFHLTPHEQVLRARLERVLRAGQTVVRAQSRESVRRSTHRRTSVSEKSEHLESPRHHPHAPCHRRNTSSSSSCSCMNRRSNTDPLPTTVPLTPSTPPRSRSRSHSHSHSLSQSHSSDSFDTDHMQSGSHPHELEPLTPPPTPPSESDLHSSTPLPGMFNVRKASASCRQMEGYVSFASVEGLGQPPGCSGLDEDEDVSETGTGPAAGTVKSTLGLGIGRIWKVVGGRLAD